MDLDLQLKHFDKLDHGGALICHLLHFPSTISPLHSNQECEPEEILLGVDSTQGGDNGAETITVIDVVQDSLYMIYVVDYSGNPTYPMSGSNAQIVLYSPDGEGPSEIIEIEGTGASRFWLVGCFLDDRDLLETFWPINKLMDAEPDNANLCYNNN